MHGTIWVDSEPGRGSAFHFTARFGLVDTEPPPAGDPSPSLIGGSARRVRILLAEDNIVNQRVAMQMLRKMGHDVVLAGNGREAFEATQHERFDLVLMDVQMPDMDGFEATAAIRQFEAKLRHAKISRRPLPVVAMTAHAMSGDRALCLSAGMDDYITKPVDAGALADLIEKFSTW